jgi:phosphatidylinositol glycan class B
MSGIFNWRSKQSKWLILSLLLFLISAYFSKGYHHFDEHFQLLEFANWKAGKTPTDQLPWEFYEQMRPALQVWIVYIFQLSFKAVGLNNPFVLAFSLRLISAFLSFFLLTQLFRQFKGELGVKQEKLFFFLTFFLWYFFYIGVRFSSENWSALAFGFGISLLYPFGQTKKLKPYFFAGILFGLAFHFRYQIAFAIFGLILWLLVFQKAKLAQMTSLILGGLLSFFLGVAVDAWFYGEWVLAPWNYLQQNLIEDKVSGFGVEPWWYYFSRFIEQGIPPLSVLLLLATLLYFIKQFKSWLSWMLVPFIAVHMLIGHKELRFLFPMVYWLPLIVCSLTSNWKEKSLNQKWLKVLIYISWMVNLIFVLIACFRPAEPQIPLYEAVYEEVGNKKATLYHFGKNPYHRVLNVHFYKNQSLQIKELEAIDSLPKKAQPNEVQLVVLGGKGKQTDLALKDAELIYSTFPNWFTKVNFNDWQSRTNVWKVYRIKQTKR